MKRVSKTSEKGLYNSWELEDLREEEDQLARYQADIADDLNDEKVLNEV